jgi:hypothetical protein
MNKCPICYLTSKHPNVSVVQQLVHKAQGFMGLSRLPGLVAQSFETAQLKVHCQNYSTILKWTYCIK